MCEIVAIGELYTCTMNIANNIYTINYRLHNCKNRMVCFIVFGLWIFG